MISETLGEMNIQGVYVGSPTTVRLWMSADFLHTPRGLEWLKEQNKGAKGIKEIIDINVGKNDRMVEDDRNGYYLLLEMQNVDTSDQAKVVTNHYLRAIFAAAENLDDLDVQLMRTSTHPVEDAMAYSTDGSPGSPSVNGNYS